MRDQSTAKFERRVLLAAIASTVVGIVYLAMAWSARNWQIWAIAVVTWLIAGASGAAYLIARRGKITLAANAMIVALIALLPAYGLFLEGAFWQLALAVITFPLYIANLVWPEGSRGRIWRSKRPVVLGALGLALTLAIELLRPFPRYSEIQSWILQALLLGMLALGVFMLVIAFARAYRRITAIRTRLIFMAVLIVLVLAGAFSISSLFMSVTDAQRQVFDQLRSVTALKRTTLRIWVNSLQSSLDTLLAEGYELDHARALMTPMVVDAQLADARSALYARFQTFVAGTPQFVEIFLLRPDGQVLLSSDDTRTGGSYRGADFLECGLQAFCMSTPDVSELGHMSIFAARPVIDQSAEVIGVLAGRINIGQLSLIVSETPLGDMSEAYLVAANHATIGRRQFSDGNYAYSEGVDLALGSRQTSLRTGTYRNYSAVSVLGVYTWVPELQMALLSEMNQSEVFRGARNTILINAGVALVAVILAAVVAYYFARNISADITELADTATRIAGGERDLTARVLRNDEIGMLAQAFNSMTEQLREFIGSLERRVEERTRGLEAVAEVSRATTLMLDPNRLLPQVVDLVQERFGLYYVGLFLVDDAHRHAVLRAGTGEAGRMMLAQGWQLAVGMGSMIGQCVASGKPMIRQQAGDTAVRSETPVVFENSFLPDTRSELALPLHYGGRIIGAMTVQSVAEAAFDDASIAILQNMVDQVAVAVENARLFAETQVALERAQEVQRRYQGQAWRDYLKSRVVRGYEWRGGAMLTLGNELPPAAQQVFQKRTTAMDEKTLLLPIVQGDQVVGVLGFESEDGRKTWSADEVALIQSLSEQLMLAAENQRLLDETQRRAAREQLSREATAEMRRSLDVTTVLRTAIRQLQESLDLTEAEVWIETETSTEGT